MALLKRRALCVVTVCLFFVASVLVYTAFVGQTKFTLQVKKMSEGRVSQHNQTPSAPQDPNAPSAGPADNNYHPDVKVVSSFLGPNVKLPHEDCVPLPSSPKPGVFICLHPTKDDKYVSGSLKLGHLWESGLISEMSFVLRRDPNLQVVDIGCNIGEYTLWAAALGRPVLAVEMLESNVNMVQKALELSHLDKLVTLVNNAVYSDHRQLKTLFLKGNLGGTRLNTSSNDDPSAMVDKGRGAVIVNTICLDDLIPLIPKDKPVYMKMDVENSEHKALAGAHRLFQERDIRYVQMEWLARRQEEIADISNFMNQHGYVPSKSLSHPSPVNIHVNTISGHDVYFVKKSAGGAALKH